MSWREFSGMNDELRKVAIRKEMLFNREYDSLLITGFKDNEDNVTMKMPDPDELELSFGDNNEVQIIDSMTQMYVSDFIAQVKSGAGTTLFKHVYPPFNGVREVLVRNGDKSEAKEYIKVIKGDMAKHMNDYAIDLVFEEPAIARAESNTTSWQPYSRAAELIEECKQNSTLLNPAKRYRKNQPENEKSSGKVPITTLPNNIAKIHKVTPTQLAPTIMQPVQVSTTAWSQPLIVSPLASSINSLSGSEFTNTTNFIKPIEDMETIKNSIRAEMAMNNEKIQEQLRAEINEAKNSTNTAIYKLDQKIMVTNSGLEEKLNILTESTNKSITSLEAQGKMVEEKIEKSYDNMGSQFEEIKNMFTQLMMTKTTGMATRIKSLTAIKRHSTHGMTTRSTKTDSPGEMLVDFPDDDGETEMIFDKTCTQESADPNLLK
jgi:hypothetical protein